MVGMIIPVVILALPYVLHVLGAGDVKLLSAIGSVVGMGVWRVIVIAFVLTAVAGLCIVIVKLAAGQRQCFTKIHLSIPIALGTAVYMLGGLLYEL